MAQVGLFTSIEVSRRRPRRSTRYLASSSLAEERFSAKAKKVAAEGM